MNAQTDWQTPNVSRRGFLQWLLGFSVASTVVGMLVPVIGYLWPVSRPVTGAVVGGPPPRPLPAYELAIKDGKVYVGKPLGQIYGA